MSRKISIEPMKLQMVQVEWSGNVNTLTLIPDIGRMVNDLKLLTYEN